MAFNSMSLEQRSAFLNAIAPWEAAYQSNSFAYVAVRKNGIFCLVQGVLWLNSSEPKTPFSHFESENVRAGHFALSDVDRTFRDFIDDFGAGEVITPQGRLDFAPGGASHSASFTPLHPSALQAQSRVNVLRITGGKQFLGSEPSLLDWELRAGITPFDGVHELLAEYALGGLFSDAVTVEIVATAILGFDGNSSQIEAGSAVISVRIASALEVDKVSVGYREIVAGKIVRRGSVPGSQFQWTSIGDMQIGTHHMAVDAAALLHCYGIYNKVAQTHWFVSDPANFQNVRRVLIEAIDPGLAIAAEFLGRVRSKGQNARDLEVAVAWLFWMHGFSTVQLGTTARTQEFSDLILMSPQGHVAIVECTTGLLKADNKMPKLVARSSSVRERLNHTGNSHVKLLPVMVSSLPRAELQADLDQATRLGVLVIAREELDQLMVRTIIPNDADKMFNLAEGEIRRLQETLNSNKEAVSEPELPL